MRIRDWSSDVCSSDLLISVEKHGDHRGFFSETYHGQAYAAAGIAADFVQEIGRASCRERACQCVDVGGRRSIKKKNTDARNAPLTLGASRITAVRLDATSLES